MSKISEIEGLSPDFFLEKRTNYLTNLKRSFAHLNQNSIIVLQGAEDVPKYDSDVPYFYFEQEPNFYYLTGIRYPHMRAILDVQTNACDVFYQQEDQMNNVWKKVATKEELQAKYNLPFHDMSEIYKFIQKRNMEVIYILSGANPWSKIPIMSADLDFVGELSYLNKRVNRDEHLYLVLCETRMIKTDSEREILKEIGKRSAEAHNEMMKAIKPGLYERDMENVLYDYMRAKYDQRFAGYPPIGCSGRGCCVLHYRDNNKELKDGDLFLADQGGRLCGYDADITTTFPVNGKFTEEQRKIYEIVLESCKVTSESSKAGEITKKQLDDVSHLVILEGLKRIGILTPDADCQDLYKKGLGRIFMPYVYGHYVGLDVHDVGPKMETKSLEMITAGMYLTVEPGIYFNRLLIDQAKANPDLSPYINFDEYEKYFYIGGVRIEENIMIFEDHYECYTLGIPRTPDEIEEFMKKNNPYCKNNVLRSEQK